MEDKKVQDMTVASWVRLQQSKEGNCWKWKGNVKITGIRQNDKGKWWNGIKSKNGKKRKPFKRGGGGGEKENTTLNCVLRGSCLAG